jgi:hypothetical protein
MVIEMFLDMVDKTMEICVIPTLASCIIYTSSFDLWMSCASFNTFVLLGISSTLYGNLIK